MFDVSTMLRNMLGQGVQQPGAMPNQPLNFNLMPKNPLQNNPLANMTNPGMGMPSAMPQGMGMNPAMNPAMNQHGLGAASMYAAQSPGAAMSIPPSGGMGGTPSPLPGSPAAGAQPQSQSDSLRKMMMMQYMMGGQDPQTPISSAAPDGGNLRGQGGMQTDPMAGLLNSFPMQMPPRKRFIGQ